MLERNTIVIMDRRGGERGAAHLRARKNTPAPVRRTSRGIAPALVASDPGHSDFRSDFFASLRSAACSNPVSNYILAVVHPIQLFTIQILVLTVLLGTGERNV